MVLASLVGGQGRKTLSKGDLQNLSDGWRRTRNESYKANKGDWELKLELLKRKMKALEPDKDEAKSINPGSHQRICQLCSPGTWGTAGHQWLWLCYPCQSHSQPSLPPTREPRPCRSLCPTSPSWHQWTQDREQGFPCHMLPHPFCPERSDLCVTATMELDGGAWRCGRCKRDCCSLVPAGSQEK